MKQSKKLLSLVLAIIMMFGTVSVVANAGLVKGEVKYDAIDGAALTPEQVADLALDYVDSDIMYSINKGKTMDLSILGEIRTDTIDHMLADVYDLYNSGWWTIGKGLLGDIGDLNLKMLKGVQRSGGDLNVIYALLQLLGDSTNAGKISKAAYGIGDGSNQLDIGLVESFMDSSDIDEINGYLGNNLGTMLAKTVYDELIYGSYGYPDKSKNMTAFPAELNTVDKALNVTVNNLLSKPQDYTWTENEDGTRTKTWNENSIVSREFVKNYDSLKIDLNTDSLLGVIDKLFDKAIAEFGPTYLNNDVKKLLMEEVGVDFIRLDNVKDAKLIQTIKNSPDYVDVAGSGVREDKKVEEVSAKLASVQNYLCDAQLWKVGGVWYFRDYQKVTQKNADGNPVLDENGNEVRVKEDRFFKANVSGANEFYDVINWDYKIDASFITKATTIDTYGSLFGSLNHILYAVLNTAINKDVISQAELDALWVDGDNTNLNANIERVAKYILTNYARRVFGKSSEFVGEDGKATPEFAAKVANSSLIGLVEYIGLPMFGDAMPQLILPENGLEDLPDNQKLYAFGAAILREFMTQISAERNYDSFIYGNTLTASTGRKFVSHTNEEWLNLILNMGMDIAFEYTNKGLVNFVAAEWPTEGISKERWQGMLNDILAWAVDYIGGASGDTSVLAGFEPSKFNAYTDSLDKLSYALNTLLPLGFISGCSSDKFAVDFNVILNDVLVPLIESLDLEGVVALFGRSNSQATTGYYNILTDNNVVSMILDLANRILKLVFGNVTLLNTENCAKALEPANVKVLINSLLTALYNRRVALLENALPIVAQFYSEWGGEQEIDTPEISLKETIELTSGAITGSTFTFSNGSTGVWRHYKDAAGNEYQDNQYAYKCTGVDIKDINDNTVSEVTVTAYPQNALDFGQSGNVTFNVSGIPAEGKVVRFDVKYIVYDEDGVALADGTEFKVSKYVYLSFNPTNDSTNTLLMNESDLEAYSISPHYVAYENGVNTIPNLRIFRLWSDDSRSGAFFPVTGAQKGISVKPFTADGTTKDAKNNAIKTKTDGAKVNGVTMDTGKNVYGNNFAVDEATYNAQTFTPGDSLTWTVKAKIYAKNVFHDDHTKETPITVYFYSGEELSSVKDVVSSEVKRMRKATDYETGDVLASKLLTTVDSTDKNGNKVLKESNFTATGVNEDGETVTKLNGTDAWNAYVTAFNYAVRLAYQPWNANSLYTHQAAYEALKVAAADLDLCKIDETKVTASAGAEKDTYAIALKNAMAAAEESLGGKGFYDYKMYRWSRYEDVYKDARNLVAAYTNQNYLTAETKYFTYRSDYKVTDLNKMIAGNAYEKYIKALYEDYTEEEIEANKASLAKGKNNYANISVLDYANAANLVTRTADRLLERDSYDKDLHLVNEIASAVNVIGITNTKGYTAKSWARYANALAAAQALVGSDLCNDIFDAKYELQVARNELRTEEADDTELRTLIAQAQAVLANASSYANTDKELGQVLAALGMEDVRDLDGNMVDLFPNAALNVIEKSYAVDETKKYDRAANALREALAKVKFNGVTVPNAVDTKVGEEEDGTAIKVKTLSIAQKLTAEQAAAQVNVSGTESVVSLNNTYALEMDEKAVYTGTGSTLTLVKTLNGVATPLYTVNLIVKGDVNGDGVIDVLDASLVELAASDNKDLSGVYFAAGNFDNTEVINSSDFQQVVNLACAN